MSKFLLGKDIILGRHLDKWVIEAGGSTARVFQATLGGFTESVALKIMTPAWIRYSLPRFLEEIKIMCQIRDIEWATHPVEFGFIHLDTIPVVDRQLDVWDIQEPGKLQGNVVRSVTPSLERFTLSQPEVQQFISQLGVYIEKVEVFFKDNHIEKDSELSDDDWLSVYNLIDRSLPYIAFETRDTIFLEPAPNQEKKRATTLRNWQKASDPSRHEVNLLLLCDEGYVYENLLPINDGLTIGIQICDILTAAHERNVAFVDHKILHYYWNNTYEHIFIIDWNMGQFNPEGLAKEEKKFDLMQFSARAFFHILTGHQAKGALDVGRTEYSQLDQVRNSHIIYQANWNSGEIKRLGTDLVQVLEHCLYPGYDNPNELKKELQIILEKNRQRTD